MVDVPRRDDLSSASRDRPEAELDEVKITPQMLEAGVKVLWGSGAVENPISGTDEILVKEIFLAVYREFLRSAQTR